MAGNLYEQGYYETGTASVTQGQTVVTGQGTAWLQIVRPADDFGKHVGMPVPIASVDSDTQITLAYPWPGPTQTAEPYRVTFTPYHVAYRQALQEIGQLLSSGNVSALAALDGAANKLPMFTAPGALELIAKQDLINGVRFDVQVADLAGRAAYDNEAAGFTVLVADVGDGRSALYTKNSVAAADWSAPAYITGPTGAAGHEAYVYIGYASDASGADFTTTFDPALDYIAILSSEAEIPAPSAEDFAGLWFNYKGATGAPWDDWQGPWQTATAYAELAGVENGGSSYICTAAHTSDAASEPGVGASWQTYWDLVAAKGADGLGTGDVVGPDSATDNNVALFGGTTGKLLKDGFPVSAFMRTLLDDADAAAGRNTLELGSSATQDVSAFATAAQGIKADNAQPALGYTPANKAGDIFTNAMSFRFGTAFTQIRFTEYGWVSGFPGWAEYIEPDSAFSFYAYNVNDGDYLSRPIQLRQDGSVVIEGALSKGSGTFLIDHPLDPANRDLAHGFVEAPRYDLIYRGTVALVDGRATVDVDAASNMSPGTFEALTTNAVVTSLQNQSGFARLRPGAITGGSFEIICEDETATDTVSWVVIAERNDAFVKHMDDNCDPAGRFIPEREKPE